jgi:sensor histidine kinase YesM
VIAYLLRYSIWQSTSCHRRKSNTLFILNLVFGRFPTRGVLVGCVASSQPYDMMIIWILIKYFMKLHQYYIFFEDILIPPYLSKSRQAKLWTTGLFFNQKTHTLFAFTHLLISSINLFQKYKNRLSDLHLVLSYGIHPYHQHTTLFFALHLIYFTCCIFTLVISFIYLFSILIRNLGLDNHLVELGTQGFFYRLFEEEIDV